MSFGLSKTNQEQFSRPGISSTGASTFVNNEIGLDPQIARLRQQSLQGITGAAGRFGGQISGLRESAVGNLPDYIQSQISPLQQSFAQQRGGLQQSLGQRGLTGSSFGQQSLGLQNIEQQRALQDARAQALSGGIGQISGLAGQELQAGTLAGEAQRQAAEDRLRQELGLFGLSTRQTGSKTKAAASFGFGR